MIDQRQPGGECPSCGRFIGPQARCPYCGAEVRQRLAVRALKIGSLGVALLGLAVLLWAATRREAPAVAIGRLAGTMNWAYIRVEGQVTRQPVYDAEEGSLQFWVDDGTGELMVSAYRAEAAALLSDGRVPVMGDRVTMEGTLRVRDEFAYLLLSAPQKLEIEAAKPAVLPIGEVEEGRLYQQVTVRGMVRDERVPYEGLRILGLRDASGQIEVVLPASADAFGPLPEVAIGQAVQVTGAVDRYREALQISVGRGSDVAVLEEAIPIAAARRSGELTAADVGSMALIEGRIVQVDRLTGGTKYGVDDGSGAVTLLVWDDLAGALAGGASLVPGATVRAQGQVAEYKGQIEILPEVAADVVLVGAAEQAAGECFLGELGGADAGRVVRVEGLLRSVEALPVGLKGTLDDGTGTVTLLLWQEVWDSLPNRELIAPGAIVRAEGEVRLYEGELEIAPRAAADLAVLGQLALPSPTKIAAAATAAAEAVPSTATPVPELAPPTATLTPKPQPSRPAATPVATPRPTVEGRAIAAIGDAEIGKVLSIAKAGITEMFYFSKGVQYRLSDGTGEITLLLWQDVLEEIAGRYDLFPGSQVQVRGEVEKYQGEMEIVPGDGGDLAVIRRGERPGMEERAVSSISAADEGRIFAVEGRVNRVESQGWLKLWLRDDTGEILIFVPERVVGYLPTGIGPGQRLRAKGEVDIYQGTLEIIPLAGADLELRR